MPSSQIYFGIAVMFLVGALVAPVSGRITDTIGGLQALCFGSVIFAAALVVLSFANGPLTYFLAWLLFGAGMHLGLNTAAYNAIAQITGQSAYRSIGALTLATGLCSTVFWPVSEAALGIVDWPTLCRIYAVVTIGVSLPAHLLLAFAYGRRSIAKADATDEQRPAHVAPARAGRAFLLLSVMLTLATAISSAISILAIDLFVALGTSRETAVFAGSLLGVAYLASRALDVSIGRFITRMNLARYVYGFLPLSLLPLLICVSLKLPVPAWLAVVTALLYGLPAGLLGILRPALPLYIFGSFSYGRRLGRLARPADIAAALAAASFAWVMALSPTLLMSIIVVLASVAFIALLALGRLVTDE